MWPFPGQVQDPILLTEIKQGPAICLSRTVDWGACYAAPQISQGRHNMTHMTRLVGIDVGKSHLDVHCLPDGHSCRVPNTDAGIAGLLASLADGPDWVAACEASGGYERRLLLAMSEADKPLYCLHPADVRAFARLTGTRAKTDRLDAKVIAHALEVARKHRAPVHISRTQSDLKQLLALRRHLTITLTDLKSLDASSHCASAKALIAKRIAQAKDDLMTLQRAIKATVAQDEAATRTAALVQSIPGVGPLMGAHILASMPELGAISHKQAASLVGVAPHARQSGKTDRGGRCQGGRKEVRRCLYMAALSAIKIKAPSLYPFYKRLREAGKPFKVAITAAMRKLVIHINATLKAQTPFTQS